MEIRRTLLMGAIAVVAYMLFLTWQQEFSPDATSVATTSSQQTQVVSSGSVPNASDQSVVNSSTPAANKIATADNSTATSQLIHVKTDTLDLEIDPRGGDIVSLKLLDYPLHLDTPDKAFPLLANSKSLLFEAQSGLIGADGTDSDGSRPLYQASASSYQLTKGDNKLVVNLTLAPKNGVSITKRYIFERGSYLVTIKNLVNNQSSSAWKGAFYGQLKRDNSGDPSLNAKGLSHMSTFIGGVYYSAEGKYEKLKFDSIKEDGFKLERKGGWIGLSQHYFLTAWIGNTKQENHYSALYRPGKGDQGYYFLRYISPLKTIAAGDQGKFSTELYVGPKKQELLSGIAPSLGKTIDYGWSWFIAQPIFAVLVFLESGQFNLFGNHFDLGFGVGNWGIAIILLTLIIKLLFFKLSASAYRSMAKMRKVAPEMQRIKKEHKDDRQKQSQAMMKLYSKEKINPIGGCLPMVIQAPVFIALYYVLLYAVDLRQAPFFGWIQDLSVMDPYYILPIIMGIAMFIQMQLNPQPADNTQAKLMKWMPIGFTFFFLWFPAGLVLYYVTNNILSIAQQYWITKKIENE